MGFVCALLWGAAAALPTSPASAAATPGAYAFAADARPVQGATGATDAERLTPGTTYRSALPRDGKLYYRLELDTASNAYAAVTAVPHAGTTVTATDGIKVSVQDAGGRSCSFGSAAIGASLSPHPITAVGTREISPTRSVCQGGGTYYLVVERVARTGSSPDAWDLEIAPVLEPRLERAAATQAPEAWNSASLTPLPGAAEPVRGGTGFAAAAPLGQGVRRDDLRPGRTLFYRVPVDWGRQLEVTAELGGSGSGTGYVSGALAVSLYNPVRDEVEDAGISYAGRPKSAVLPPLPPVDYTNRHAVSGRVNTMRFAGSYYLSVHLAAQVADTFGDGPFGLTLRVRLTGAAKAGPGYAGRSRPRDAFEVTAQDRAASAEAGAGGDSTMRLLAAGGLGTGTALLAVLGGWTLLARRRAGTP